MLSLRHLAAVIGLFLLEACANYSTVKELPESTATTTQAQLDLAANLKPLAGDPDARLGHLLDAAHDAQERLKRDPEDKLALADNNFAVARVMELVYAKGWEPWLSPKEVPSANGSSWSLTIAPPKGVKPEALSHAGWKAADRLQFDGELIGGRTIKQGLGGAMVAIAEKDEIQIYDKFSPDKIFYAITCVFYSEGKHCRIQLMDPLENEDVVFHGHTYPLAADFQAPLALSLAKLHPKLTEIQGFFRPAAVEETARLARLQSYNPNKIPLLFIHGLGNSPATFMPLIDFLRNDRKFRENYQVWYFTYPTGLPYPLAADALDKQLDDFKERYAGHRNFVIIGHSMGAMIARRLITDSGMKIWDSIYPKPPEEMPFKPKTLAVIRDAIIFESRKDIDRVIFASASHRGSENATNFIGKLGANIIGDPIAESDVSREAYELARPKLIEEGFGRIPNSVNLLDPDGNFVQQMHALPTAPGIPYHSLIGDRGKGGHFDRTDPERTDGVVPYWSSHIRGAASELIIPSDHWSHLHPLGMSEIKRILLLHLEQRSDSR